MRHTVKTSTQIVQNVFLFFLVLFYLLQFSCNLFLFVTVFYFPWYKSQSSINMKSATIAFAVFKQRHWLKTCCSSLICLIFTVTQRQYFWCIILHQRNAGHDWNTVFMSVRFFAFFVCRFSIHLNDSKTINVYFLSVTDPYAHMQLYLRFISM